MTEIIFDMNTLWYIVIIILAIFIPLFIMEIVDIISRKIHNSYHKGYKEATNDNLKYYSTIKDIKDDFSIILTSLKKDFVKLTVETTTLLVEFNDNLSKYQNI